MNAGILNKSLPAMLFLSTLLGLDRTTLAQTTAPPLVTIVASDHHAAEAEQQAGAFTVNRNGTTEDSLLVFYELSGTARNGADYLELPRSITIPAGAASALLTIKPINDSLAEGTETVVATLLPSPTASPIEPYRVGFPSSDVILLADNDSPATIPPPCAPVPDGLVNWWPGNGNPREAILHRDGVLLNGATFGEGKVGRGFLLDGEDDCVRIPFALPPGQPSNYSVEAWVKPISQVADREGQELIVGQAFQGPQLAVRAGVSGMIVRWEFAVDPVNFAAAVSTREIPIGQFSHLAGTWDGSTLRLYINGILEAENTTTNLPATSTCPFFIGGFFDGCGHTGQFFHGLIDEASLYTRALSAEAVARIFHAGGAGKCPPYEPPAVALQNPTNRAIFTAPANIYLVSFAPDFGRVEQVEFFSGNRSLGLGTFLGGRCATCPNWVLDWTNVPAGEYTVTAQATDLFGRKSNSDPVYIVVKRSEIEPVALVSKGSLWKHLDDGSDQGTAWREPGFVDSEWKSGPAQLGFGDGDEATILRAGNEARRFVTYYFRRAFEAATAERISALTLRVLRDDGAVVYLNGHAVFRSNMPDGPIGFNTLALQAVGADGENVFHSAVVDPRLLVNGRNVLAVEVHQVATESADVSFDLELVASAALASPVVNIEAVDAEAAEISPLLDVPPNPAVFKVTRTGETSKALKVFYRLTGTAGNGLDYRELSGSVTIPEGGASAEIVAQPIDDALIEGRESVVATVIPPVLIDPPVGSDLYAVGSRNRAEAHILDSDEAPPNALPAVRIAQPAGGSTFPALATINIVAEVRDPDGWVGLVEFFANERKIGEQSVVFIREPDPGQAQSFTFEWKEVPQGEYTLTARATDNRAGKGASGPVRVRVGEERPPIPIVTIYARDASAREGTNSSGEINSAAFVVRRTGETNAGLTVFLSIHGTAENGVDYATLPNSVIIPAGHLTARIVVKPIRDEQKEALETVLLVLEPDPSLGPVARYAVGEPSRAAATIADSDQPPPADVRTADGMFKLSLPGENGVGYRLECSTDLITWMPLGTNVVTDGAIHFVDPDADEHAHRFYRVVPETKVDLDD